MDGSGPNVMILGAGAMGCLYAALLAPFARVTIVDGWAGQIDAIRANGLTLTGIGGTLRPQVAAVHARDAESLAATGDIAIALVSAMASPAAAELARTVLRPDGYLLTLQNGIGNIEAYAAVLGAHRVLAGLSYHSAILRGPGTAEHTHRGPTWLGELDRARTPRLAALVALMERAGAEPREVDDVVSYVWTKFVHNSAINAVCALAGLRVGEIPTTPGADELQTRIIEEALAVIRAKGIALSDDDPMGSIKAFCRVKFNKPSMLQQMEASRETEIEALNGAIVREGRALGVPTPYNEAVTWMVRSMQHRRIRDASGPPIDYEAMEREAKKAAHAC